MYLQRIRKKKKKRFDFDSARLSIRIQLRNRALHRRYSSSTLRLSRKEIIDALIHGRGLSSDTIEKLARIAPTEDEASEIIAYDGDPTSLADVKSFLYHILKSVPTVFSRFNAMLFRSNYDSEVFNIKESLHALEAAYKKLRTSGLILKLLETLLKAGNRLNAGTARGNAQAFNLTVLTKLSDVKSSKMTLLHSFFIRIMWD